MPAISFSGPYTANSILASKLECGAFMKVNSSLNKMNKKENDSLKR